MAYTLAYAGIKAHHKTIDTTFSTLAFGGIATSLTYVFTEHLNAGQVMSSLSSFCVTLIIALLWRRLVRSWIRSAFRTTRISYSTDTPTAWKELFDLPRLNVTQIAVQTRSGTWLRCDDTSKFNDAPVPPVTLGADGGILMYLTHVQEPDSEAKALSTVLDENYGARITYVPPSEIVQVAIRHKKQG